MLKSQRAEDVGWAIRNAVVIFFLLVLFIGLFVGRAFPAETQTLITGIDLTTSTGVHEEFQKNRKEVGEVIRNTSTAGTRIVVIGISQQSFGATPILDRTTPMNLGRFREHLSEWRLKALNEWEGKKKVLEPAEHGSDIFGFFARASLIFKDQTNGTKRLIVFSDMRQVGRGYNFERSIGDPTSLVKKVKRQGFIPDLTGVQVWILGVHTAGIDESLWAKLSDFWKEYTNISKAELKAFSQDRDILRQLK